jgi:hypothetical protein
LSVLLFFFFFFFFFLRGSFVISFSSFGLTTCPFCTLLVSLISLTGPCVPCFSLLKRPMPFFFLLA